MDYRLDLTQATRKSGKLSETSVSVIREKLHDLGFVVVGGMFDPALLARLHEAYLADYGSLGTEEMSKAAHTGVTPFLEVGARRYEIVVRMTGIFRDRDIYGGELPLALMRNLLGACHLSSFTIVVSHPGSEQQHVHRDYGLLFGDDPVGATIPAYAINLGVPLIDVDMKTGPTAVWPGSHRWEAARSPKDGDERIVPETKRGDCVLMDYRTFHAGMPNSSGIVRPNLYLVYSRPWFFDEVNHRHRVPLDMPIQPDEAMPDEVRNLLTRAFTENNRRIYAARR